LELASDYSALLESLLPFAQQQLEKHGEFSPFGATMLTSGDIGFAASYLDEEHWAAAESLELLIDGLRSSASLGEIRAAGVCFDALTIPPGASEKADAICLKLAHATLDPIDVFFPYKKGWLGSVSYTEGFAAEGSLTLFPPR
jgi:hypothetical protein